VTVPTLVTRGAKERSCRCVGAGGLPAAPAW
jgi:hypothetical protein